ncbi:MAG: hypothetical protein RIS94_1389 [Pseudomonadota bacterium]|jgi:hypothetical protein
MSKFLTSLKARLASIRPMPLLLAASMAASTAWGAWATHKLLALEHRGIVTVRLSGMMGDFVGAEARAGHTPEETRARIEAYLKAVQASVDAMGRDGRTVLVSEAVVAGAAPDMTEAVRADVARRMGSSPNAHP